MKLKLFITLILLILNDYKSLKLKQANPNGLDIYILPSEKYKMTPRDVLFLKSEVENQIMGKINSEQGFYDELAKARQMVNSIPVYHNPYMNMRLSPINPAQNSSGYRDASANFGTDNKKLAEKVDEGLLEELLDLKKQLKKEVDAAKRRNLRISESILNSQEVDSSFIKENKLSKNYRTNRPEFYPKNNQTIIKETEEDKNLAKINANLITAEKLNDAVEKIKNKELIFPSDLVEDIAKTTKTEIGKVIEITKKMNLDELKNLTLLAHQDNKIFDFLYKIN